jgi:iron complex transport system ATP-binding protein
MLKLQQVNLKQDHETVFSQLNCEFKTGQFWGVVGQNGVGKSTLLQAMAGINIDCDGQIEVDGCNMKTISPVQRAQKISYLLQDQEPCLAFSVQDAVGMGRFPWQTSKQQDSAITQEVMKTCRIEYLQHRSILKLSGGERRKVEIATCLAQQADYLLLDEPLNHLDLVYRAHILQVFKASSKSQCVVMVCHDLEAVQKHCSHVLMLLANNCYLSGTSATILNDDNLKRLFNEHSENH